MAKVTLKTIAEVVGISAQAVSAALSPNGKANVRVSVETRDKVRKIAYDLGYRPHGGARAARLQSFRNIGVILVDPHIHDIRGLHAFQPGVLIGANDAAVAEGYCVSVLRVSDRDIPDEGNWPTLLSENRVDGFIVSDQCPPELKDYLERSGMPSVWANNNRQDEHDCVYFDDVAGGRMVTRRLIEAGHRKIGFVGGSEGLHYSVHDRHVGYVQEMQANGLTPWPGHASKAPSDDEFAEFYEDWLSTGERPTAIVCSNHGGAMRIDRVLYKMRLHIPEDMSVVTWFDDQWMRECTIPRHAGMLVNMRHLGRMATEMLLEKLETKQPVKSTVLGGEFIDGGSIAPVE